IHFLFGWFFRIFNWTFRRTTTAYTRAVGLALRGSAVVLFVYGGLVLLTWYGFTHLPTGYIPNQDQGKLYVTIQLPDATANEPTPSERRGPAAHRLAQIVRETPGGAHTTAVAGQSHPLGANGSNSANCFVPLDEFDRRRQLARELGQDMTDLAIIARLQERLS